MLRLKKGIILLAILIANVGIIAANENIKVSQVNITQKLSIYPKGVDSSSPYSSSPYIDDDYLTGTINDDHVNIRKFPDINAAQVGQVNKNTKVKVYFRSDNYYTDPGLSDMNFHWYFCWFDDIYGHKKVYGWICGEYISDVDKPMETARTFKIGNKYYHPAYYFCNESLGAIKQKYYGEILGLNIADSILGLTYIGTQKEDTSVEYCFTKDFESYSMGMMKITNIVDKDFTTKEMLTYIADMSVLNDYVYLDDTIPEYNYRCQSICQRNIYQNPNSDYAIFMYVELMSKPDDTNLYFTIGYSNM
jgi:hypothetical protein